MLVFIVLSWLVIFMIPPALLSRSNYLLGFWLTQLYKCLYNSAVTNTRKSKRTLGTQLRYLLELLDGDVDSIYREEGLDYRSRYTPIMRVLAEHAGVAIRDLAATGGISHSAACQTVAKMRANGLVAVTAGSDSREQIVRLTKKGKQLLPRLMKRWAATNAAAAALDRDLPSSLSEVVEAAIQALERKPFRERIRTSERALLKRKSR